MSTITQHHVGTPVVLDIDGVDVPGVLLALMDDLKYGARVQVGERIEMHRAANVRPAPAHESKGDEPLRDVAQRALEVLAFVGDWDHRGESVAEAWNAHATAADGWNALLQDLEAALSQPAAHPIWLGMRESVLCEAANAVGEQMKRWPTDDRAVYVAAECAAAVRALIANPQAKGPVKVWCETCNGSGEVHQEHQAGCWVGGSHACPDCDGKGYSERATQAPAVTPSQAAQDVLAERQRQISVKGYNAAEDDENNDHGQLAGAAACYATHGNARMCPADWPWDADCWKPKDKRRNLIRAGALILAEIERLDRASHVPVQPTGGADGS